MVSHQDMETLKIILELCGFFDSSLTKSTNDNTSPRLQLMASLQKLEVQLTHSPPWNDSAMNEVVSISIVELESSIHIVRNDSLSYLEELVHEHAEIVELTKQLEDRRAPECWILLCRSLRSAYAIQNQKEENSIRRLLEDLDAIYVIDDEISKKVLNPVITCLRRDDLILRNDFLEMVSVLIQLIQLDVKGDIEGANDITSLSQRPKVKEASEELTAVVDRSIVNATTVLDAVDSFLNSLESQCRCTEAKFAAILVVGQEGSGKTYLCNTISSLSEKTCLGEYNTMSDEYFQDFL
jgi:chromosomal replication initiation ATPase DnaA